MPTKAIQDYYADEVSHCYGCGRLNEHGLQIKSFWDGNEAVCSYHTQPYHTAIPGFVYGGLIASLIDCHSAGTAAAATYGAENRDLGTEPPLRYVTASLHVDYLRPTPLGKQLLIRAKVKEISGRKVVVTSRLLANGELCAEGEAVLVQMPEQWIVGPQTSE